MSSPHNNNSNSDSVRIQIPDAHINTFLHQTKNGKDCNSQLLSIKNIPFHIGLYPNGKKGKKHEGNIQFIVAPDKDKDSLVNYVAVYCQIYCPTLGIMFKGTKSLYKTSDILQLQLSKDEHQDIIIKNGIMFICHIEVLKIKYKNNSSMSGLTRKFSTSLKRRRSSGGSSFSSDLINVFEPRTFHAKSQVNIEMVINHKITHPIYSEDINNMWCLCIDPNMSETKTKSRDKNIQLIVNMIRLPHHKIRSIEVDYTVEIIPLIPQQSGQCIPVRVYGRNVLFSYKKSTETIDLFKPCKLDEFGGMFKLKMIIRIIRIFQDLGKNAKGKEITDSWSDFSIERVEFTPETLQCGIDGQQYGNLNNYDTDDIKHSQYSPTGSMDDVAENISVFTSISKSNNKSKRSSYKERKEPQRKTSLSTHLSPTSNTSYDRNSITSFVDAPLQHIPENKTEEVTVEHWDPNDEIQHNDDNKYAESEQSQYEIKSNIFTNKFAHWLCQDVKLRQYLQNFQMKEWDDIRMIENFNDGTLVSVGISNEQHRKLILKEVKKFQQGHNNFQQFIQKHQTILKPFEKFFQNNGIWTIDELQRIKSKSELCMIIKSADMLNDVWNIIQSLPLQLQINQKQRKQTTLVKELMNHCTDLMTIYKQSEDREQIQQQVSLMLNEVFMVVKNQKANYHAFQNNIRTSVSYVPSITPSDENISFPYSHKNNSNTNDDHIISEPNPPVKQTVNKFRNSKIK